MGEVHGLGGGDAGLIVIEVDVGGEISGLSGKGLDHSIVQGAIFPGGSKLTGVHAGLFRRGQEALNHSIGLLVSTRGLFPGLRVCGEGDKPAVSKQAVVGPVSGFGTNRNRPASHGDGVNQSHDHHKDGQGQDTVGDDLVNTVGGSQASAGLFHYAANDGGDVLIALIGDDGFTVIVQFFFAGSDSFLNLSGQLHASLKGSQDLFIFLKQFDSVPAQLAGIHMAGDIIFNYFQRLLHPLLERMNRTEGLL